MRVEILSFIFRQVHRWIFILHSIFILHLHSINLITYPDDGFFSYFDTQLSLPQQSALSPQIITLCYSNYRIRMLTEIKKPTDKLLESSSIHQNVSGWSCVEHPGYLKSNITVCLSHGLQANWTAIVWIVKLDRLQLTKLAKQLPGIKGLLLEYCGTT